MLNRQGSPSAGGQVLPPTHPFSVLNTLRTLAQMTSGGPTGALTARDLAAQVAFAQSRQRGVPESSQTSQSSSSPGLMDWLVERIKGKTPPPMWTAAPPKSPALVDYNGHTVSDPRVREALDQISKYFASSTVNVRSGDRNFRPKGSPANSPHLTHQAADFHVVGQTDDQVKRSLKDPSMTEALRGLRVLQHGPHTATEGAHIHIDSRGKTGQPARFMHEGMTPAGKGHYIDDNDQ